MYVQSKFFSVKKEILASEYSSEQVLAVNTSTYLKLLRNKKGQKNLGYPRKKQSFYKEKDCFFLGYPKFFWLFLFWSGFSYSSKISGKCTRTDRNAIWRYFASIRLLFITSKVFSIWVDKIYEHP